MMQELQTDRLILKPLCLADAEQAQQLFSQWDIVKHMNASIPWPYPADGAFRYYRDVSLPAIELGRE